MRAADVVVNVIDNVAVFEPQNRKAADCLSLLGKTTLENIRDQLVIDSDKKQEVIAHLRTAGFVVWG